MIYAQLWRGVLLILSLSVLGYLTHVLNLQELIDTELMDRWVRGRGFTAEAVFVLAGAVLVAVGIPRQLVSFFAGYSLGLEMGLLFGLLATVFGAALDFWYARMLGRALIRRVFPKQIQHLDRLTRDDPFLKALCIRLLPAGNNMLTSMVAGVSGIAALPFLLGSALGFVPQTLIFVLVGNGAKVNPLEQLLVAVVLFFISGGLAIYWYRQLRVSQREGLDTLNVNPISVVMENS